MDTPFLLPPKSLAYTSVLRRKGQLVVKHNVEK
jgi:hypothetical protein